jgi:hypothetical protein
MEVPSQCIAGDDIHFVSPSLGVSFPVQKSIVQFFSVASTENPGMPATAIYILVPNGNQYMNIYVDTLNPSEPNGPPEVVSVFTRDVDGEEGDELLVITGERYYHSGGDTEGYQYYTRVYKNPRGNRPLSGLTRLMDIEGKIGGGFEGKIENKREYAPYKDAAGVRKILENLGY